MNMKELEKKIKEFKRTKEFGKLKTLTWSRCWYAGQRVMVAFESRRGKRVYHVHNIPEEVSASCLWERLEEWIKEEPGCGIRIIGYLELEEIYGEEAQLRKDFPKDSLVEVCTTVCMDIGYGIVENYEDGQVRVRCIFDGRVYTPLFFRESLTLVDPDDFDPKWECVSPMFTPEHEEELEFLRTKAGMKVFRLLLDASEQGRVLTTKEKDKVCRLCAFLCIRGVKSYFSELPPCKGLRPVAFGFTRGVEGCSVPSSSAYQYFLGYKTSTDSLSRKNVALVRTLIHNNLIVSWLFS